MNMQSPPLEPSRRAFSYKGFRFFWLATLLTNFGVQIMAVSLGWQIYDATHQPILLGLVGLSLFLPGLILVLLTGLVADRFNRRLIMTCCLGVEFLGAVFLLFYAHEQVKEVRPIFALLVILGTARAFLAPASSSLAPNLVPTAALSNAITLNASAWQFAGILGPVAGGLLYGLGPSVAFGVAAVLSLIAAVSALMIPKPVRREAHQASSLDTLTAGFRYILGEKVVLGAISLDLFAVLLGGAMALLPVYARDILHAGPLALGLLRGAPGIGAIVTAVAVARFPVRDHAGKILFGFVAGFGLFTAIFGLSTSVWVAIPALALAGACDMVSVTIRETIMQLWTPDAVRGRVSAVNSVFIGASNELGEFRAGMAAAWLGAVPAVVLGGLGTLAVAVIWSWAFPGLRKQRALDRRMVAEPVAAAAK
ncbi:MAG TPA: MFS transporter [Devosiaceae bacterium]|nr:MFS transporter [Devosiaceae bacterium]